MANKMEVPYLGKIPLDPSLSRYTTFAMSQAVLSIAEKGLRGQGQCPSVPNRKSSARSEWQESQAGV